MLDDYSLRLLAEIGIDVYVPRAASTPMHEPVRESPAASKPSSPNADPKPLAARESSPVTVAIVAERGRHDKLLNGIAQALRFAGEPAAIVDGDANDAVLAMRGVVVLGESLARSVAASFNAAQHARLEWVICGEPDAVARSAIAKRALWGEIKRIARRLDADRAPAVGVR